MEVRADELEVGRMYVVTHVEGAEEEVSAPMRYRGRDELGEFHVFESPKGAGDPLAVADESFVRAETAD